VTKHNEDKQTWSILLQVVWSNVHYCKIVRVAAFTAWVNQRKKSRRAPGTPLDPECRRPEWPKLQTVP